MHGRKRRFGRRPPLSGGDVQELCDGKVGLIDPIRAGSRMSRRGGQNERHARRSYRVSNDHFILLGSSGAGTGRDAGRRCATLA